MSESDSTTWPAEADQALQAVQDALPQLLALVPRPLRTLRVQAGGVTLELDWAGQPDSDPQAATSATFAPPPDNHAENNSTGDSPTRNIGNAENNGTDDGLEHIRAPTVGVFYRAPEPNSRPFVNEGDLVRPGQQVGIIETMKMMIPIEADRAGRVVEVLVPNEASVEYGERLFALAGDVA